MSNFNKVILMGHLTRDPEAKTLPSGTPVCEIGLAVNRRWNDAQGQQREEVLFVDGTAFGKRADALVAWFKKGTPIHIEGYLKLDRWEDESGASHSKIRVMIERFSFVGSTMGNPAKAAKPQASNGNGRAKRPATRRTTTSRPAPVEAPETPAEVSTDNIPFEPYP